MKRGEDRGVEERRRRRRSYPSAAALSLSRILSSPSSLADWAELLRTATRSVLCGLRSCSSGVNKVPTRSRDVILRIHRKPTLVPTRNSSSSSSGSRFARRTNIKPGERKFCHSWESCVGNWTRGPTGLKIFFHTRRSGFGPSDVRMVRD